MTKVLVTGGEGFVGKSLIRQLLTKKKYSIVSLDNNLTSVKDHHFKKVKYFTGNTWDAKEILKDYKFDIIFHFGEYSRISTSFEDIEILQKSIMSGTPVILELARKWNAKLIYSASSSGLGSNNQDQNISPYSWMKSKVVELIKNYNRWYDLNYQICYFFNVYGSGQLSEGNYATVIGIFLKQFKEGKKCTVIKPGTQTRDFTHIDDVVSGLISSLNIEYNYEWFLRRNEIFNIIEVAEIFGEYEMIEERQGERFETMKFSSDTNKKLNWYPKNNLKDYINLEKQKLTK